MASANGPDYVIKIKDEDGKEISVSVEVKIQKIKSELKKLCNRWDGKSLEELGQIRHRLDEAEKLIVTQRVTKTLSWGVSE